MLFNIISAAALVFLSVVLWKSMTTPKAPASRARKASRSQPGPWEAGNNQRRGAP